MYKSVIESSQELLGAATLDFSEESQRAKIDTTLLRFFAIALIVNSHLGRYYPTSHLAFDGMLGNSIFFLVSGLGLSISSQRKKRRFVVWIRRRIKRIYPTIFIVTFTYYMLIDGRWDNSLTKYFGLFVWPTPYSFIKQLLVYYLIFFFISRVNSRRAYLCSIATTSILYLVIYITSMNSGMTLSEFTDPLSWISWIFYFQVMLFGGYLGLWNITRTSKKSHRLKSLFTCMICYLTIKAMMSLEVVSGSYFLIHLALVPTLFFLVECLSVSDVMKHVSQGSLTYKVVKVVASMTLELYVVHFCLIDAEYALALVFPLNIVLFVVTSTALSLGLSWVCQNLLAHGRLRKAR